MSTMIMSACWPLQMPPTQKAVLISLADNANDHGECWPSQTKIAERTCLSERAVRDAIKSLEVAGYLVADRSNGRHTRYIVTSTPAAAAAPAGDAAPANGAGKPRQELPVPRQMAPVPRQELPPNRKEPTRTVRSNRQTRDVLEPAVAEALEGIDPALVTDFLAVRKAKRAPLTATALRGIQGEAAKAGITLEAALQLCCERNWQSFRADWAGAAPQRPAAPAGGGSVGSGRELL